MNVLVAAKLRDFTLANMIKPISHLEEVEKIYLVRRTPLDHPKVVTCCPPKVLNHFRWSAELYRFFIIFWLTCCKKIDVLVGIHFYYHCVYIGIVGKIFRKPYIFSIIENPKFWIKSKNHYILEKGARKIFVRGSKSKKFYTDFVGIEQNQIDVLPDMYMPSLKKIKSVKKKYDLVFLGDLVREKRVDVLLETVREVKRKKPLIKVAIIGRGPLKKELIDLQMKYHLEKNVFFLGYVKDVYEIIEQAKVFIMTSETEGLPIVLQEASNMGLPVVVPDVGDMTDYAKHHENAIVVEPLNVEQFVQAVFDVLDDQVLYHRLSQRGLEIYMNNKDKFTLDYISSNWHNVLIQNA